MKKEMAEANETMNSRNTKFDFAIFRPGGNDTCLVMTPEYMPLASERKRINDFIQKVYPNVEQVGFVNLDPAKPKLMMAGGEFCGNATRSTAWQLLQGKPGEIMMQVSGVNEKLKAGIATNGEAFAQMPIYKEPSRITKDSNKGYLVEMEGITHYIDFDTTAISGLSLEEIKTKAMKRIKEKGLDRYPAAGIIYVTNSGESLRIDPVVYVRDINTLYYETACGSGTTALGLVLALQKEQSIKNIPVIQPSGLEIKISVDFDGETFKSAQIQGPIEILNKGSIELGEDSLVTEKIDNPKKLQQALLNGNLTSLYKDVFSKFPYFEQFTDKEVEEIFMEYVNSGLLFVTKTATEIIGFGGSVPMRLASKIAETLKLTTEELNNSWYIADVGVKECFRRKRIARRLNEAQLELLEKDTVVIMRTSEFNIASQALYRSLNFRQISGVIQEVEQKRITGEVRKDKRIFMERKL